MFLLFLGEGTRLLASLVKNGRSVELMRNVVKCQGIPPLVAMVSSEHLVMQNEALVALTLISSTVLGLSSQCQIEDYFRFMMFEIPISHAYLIFNFCVIN